MKHIYFTHNAKVFQAIVDDDDYERLKQYRWHYVDGYARRSEGRRKFIAMHHDILPREAGLETDHINRNRLDNRKENLRVVTRRGNAQNLTNNTSGAPGIAKNGKKWQANIRFNGKPMYLGTFLTVELAYQARQAFIKEHNLV
jgi:hypothetical protein